MTPIDLDDIIGDSRVDYILPGGEEARLVWLYHIDESWFIGRQVFLDTPPDYEGDQEIKRLTLIGQQFVFSIFGDGQVISIQIIDLAAFDARLAANDARLSDITLEELPYGDVPTSGEDRPIVQMKTCTTAEEFKTFFDEVIRPEVQEIPRHRRQF